ncbi:type VI secretion system accessory protein TagJ [Achromobacter sp. UMC46]|uniref:type VI secretion system accessory protein TagJ n=1 Tax=Achromobacter sp. UMC46 TaxID=1862319 RepID=UPI00160091F2|nr:type VI secretion system accessory protein TagJ [Achromobacter sp. UMC46]MBB1598108.1 ImpE family protein [Achromobacter sp. UMC46]
MSIAAVPFSAISLSGQLDDVQAQIRHRPADADLRAQLFQLLVAQGDWARAAEQLEVCGQLSAQARPLVAMYASAISAEREREAVLAGEGEPFLLGEAEDWMRDLVSALRLDGRGAPAEAAAVRGQALQDAAASAGAVQAATHDAPLPFHWICDGDSRLGPVFEFLGGGQYAWLPFLALKRVRLLAPEGLCDMVWARAEIELADGKVLQGMVPARYPPVLGGRMVDLPDAVKLARVTEWRALHGETYAGVGQKMWMTDAGEFALLDIRSLELA